VGTSWQKLLEKNPEDELNFRSQETPPNTYMHVCTREYGLFVQELTDLSDLALRERGEHGNFIETIEELWGEH
jgi:hypothetical protein